MSASRWFFRLSLTATVLALVVVVLGAYVRLSDAGLGCPDWPGCYGHLGVPAADGAVAQANEAYPGRPVEAAKGWKEMTHRYVAGALGLLILAAAITAWQARRVPGQPWKTPFFLVALVIFQAALGMWTVTWKLKPIVVMAHLLGGMSVLSLLWWQTLRTGRMAPRAHRRHGGRGTRVVLLAGLLAVAGQIALGGWTSANYAAVACNEFPSCSLGEYWPETDFVAGFDPWHGIGPSYEYGVHLSHQAKIAIHLAHRIGAAAVTVVLLVVAATLARALPGGVAPRAVGTLLFLLAVQLTLGVSNVLFNLPLPVAVAHNADAALLLLTLVTLNHVVRPPDTR